jgi:hypothetical protein
MRDIAGSEPADAGAAPRRQVLIAAPVLIDAAGREVPIPE